MPEIIAFDSTFAPSGDDLFVSFPIHLECDNVDVSQVEIEVTIDEAYDLARTAPFRRFRPELYLDLGDGSFTRIPPGEIADIETEEDLENYADQLDFTLVGEKWSPWVSAIIRGKTPVRLDLTMGAPGREITKRRFDGVIAQASYDPKTRTARIAALDDALRYSEILANPYIEPNSGQTRLEILLAILAEHSVPVGDIDLGDGGDTEITKPQSQADVRLFEFLRSFVKPADAHIWFEGGKFYAKRFDPTEPVAMRLTPRNISSISSIDVPPTATPTKFRAVTVRFETVNADGLRTRVTEHRTRGDYAPKGAVVEQWNSDGSLHPVDYGWPEAERETSLLRITETFKGATLIRFHEEEWGWFARGTARKQWTVIETLEFLDDHKCYQYADGTWRFEPVERYRVIRERTIVYEFDANERLFRTTEEERQWRFYRYPVGRISAGGVEENPFGDVAVTEAGEGVNPSYEEFGKLVGFTRYPNQRIVTEREIDESGSIDSETITSTGFGLGAAMSSDTEFAYVYGLENKTYWNQPAETWAEAETTQKTIYSTLDEESYRVSKKTVIKNDPETGGDKTTNEFQDVYGVRPLATSLQPETRSQELAAEVTDEVRSALNGEILEAIHSELAQDEGDVERIADAAAREAGAWQLSVDMPIEPTLHKARWVEIDGDPAVGLTARKCRIMSLRQSYSTKRQSLRLRYCPPEVL